MIITAPGFVELGDSASDSVEIIVIDTIGSKKSQFTTIAPSLSSALLAAAAAAAIWAPSSSFRVR
jgi:hypothetical protein